MMVRKKEKLFVFVFVRVNSILKGWHDGQKERKTEIQKIN